MTSQEQIQYYWKRKNISILDLVYADGSIVSFKENWCRKKYNILCKSTLKTYKVDYPLFEDDAIEIYNSVTNSLNGYIVYYGAGCMGNEGFVAYTDDNDKLLWSMFFTFSNPFLNLEIIDNNIIARTERDFIFTIPVENPEQISCVPTNSWDIELIKEEEARKRRGYNQWEVLNKGLELFIKFGSDFKAKLLKQFPKLDNSELIRCENLANLALKRGNNIIKQNGSSVDFDEFVKLHQTEQTWIDDKNMNLIFEKLITIHKKN